MVERQPNRPNESELKGAVLRIRANDYWIQPNSQEGSQRAAAIVSLGIWVPMSLIRRVNNHSREPIFDHDWRNYDRRLIEREREIEGLNPDESSQEYIERKHRELLRKKD